MDCIKEIANASFLAMGTTRIGKSDLVATPAWQKCTAVRKIGVGRRDRCETDKWDCTYRLPFNAAGFDKLREIMASETKYSVVLEFGIPHQKPGDLKRDGRILASILEQAKQPVRLMIDAFEYCASSELATVSKRNPNIIVGYCFHSLDKLSEYEVTHPEADAHIFLRSYGSETIDLASRLLGNPQQGNAVGRYAYGQYVFIPPDGHVFKGSFIE